MRQVCEAGVIRHHLTTTSYSHDAFKQRFINTFFFCVCVCVFHVIFFFFNEGFCSVMRMFIIVYYFSLTHSIFGSFIDLSILQIIFFLSFAILIIFYIFLSIYVHFIFLHRSESIVLFYGSYLIALYITS